jgi:hypothetical protein
MQAGLRKRLSAGGARSAPGFASHDRCTVAADLQEWKDLPVMFTAGPTVPTRGWKVQRRLVVLDLRLHAAVHRTRRAGSAKRARITSAQRARRAYCLNKSGGCDWSYV